MKCADFFKGMFLGLAAGVAAGMMVAGKKKNCKNIVCRFLKSAGQVVDDISSMF